MTLIIISYWTGHKPRVLFRLLDEIQCHDALLPYSITIVCNGGDITPLQLPKKYSNRRITVLNRENSGFNIGAWEFGWRNSSDGDHILFLQDECQILQSGWLLAFLKKFQSSPDIGLVGENINWRRTWSEQRLNPVAAGCLNKDDGPKFNSVDFLHDHIVNLGIPPGESADHLQSLMLFSSRKILREIGGFPTSDNYAQAVGMEIAISKKVQAHGYAIAMVGHRPFSYIGHPQWSSWQHKKWIKLKQLLRPAKASIERFLGPH